MSDEIALEVAIIENLQREDLSPLDEAAIFARMTSELGYSIRKLAERIGKDKGYVENRLRLMHAPADIRALVAERSDTISHAYELMKITDQARRSELAAQVLRGELSLARLKSVVRDERPEPAAAPEVVAPSIFPYAAPNERPIVAAAAKQPAPSASAPVSTQAAAIASASDAALTNARDSLASSIDALAAVLHEIDQPEAGAPLSETDRANMAKRKGIVATIHEFSHAAHLDEDGLAGAYTLGGGPAATMGRDAEGRLLLPAVSLWCLVPGLRAADPKGGRERLVAFLVATFEEVVYI